VNEEGAVALKLPKTCEAGFDLQPLTLLVTVLLNDKGIPDADRLATCFLPTHLTTAVLSSRLVFPQKSAKPGDPRVTLGSGRVVRTGSINMHATKFVHLENYSAFADTILLKQSRSW